MAHFIVPKKTYYLIFAALMVLTVVTVAVAFYLDLGVMNTVVAMTIAVVKALLVVLYFMHLRYSHRLTWIFAGASVLWLVILISLTAADYVSRLW